MAMDQPVLIVSAAETGDCRMSLMGNTVPSTDRPYRVLVFRSITYVVWSRVTKWPRSKETGWMLEQALDDEDRILIASQAVVRYSYFGALKLLQAKSMHMQCSRGF